jgi:hypothetical protein
MPTRRGFMKTGLAAPLFASMPWASLWAQSEGATRLLRAPKLALVVGNSAYKVVAPLRNPSNDANAITHALKEAGFDVTLRLDATRSELLGAMDAHVQALGARRAVGLFYFAGHGLQLAWRNYLVPVDARIAGAEDVARGCVDIATLIEGIGRARNPMNVVVLDACRENPFGKEVQDTRRGLSQMDAPGSTLLAYATSPGNVASDGEGANGVYTSHLLQEMKVPAAKIEDVFKRVRLGVRRRTNGAQVPWESTSLEEDFYFQPPADLKAQSEAERDREFQEQLAAWEKIQHSTDAATLTRFILLHPSGDFSELAQLQLDRVLAAEGEKQVQIASSDGNPFTKGSARADTRWRVGDRYVYRRTDALGRQADGNLTDTVEELTDTEVRYRSGLVTDLLGNRLQNRGADGRSYSPNQLEPGEFWVGKQWTTRFHITQQSGRILTGQLELRIPAREPVTVPAGTFNAFLVEGRGTFVDESGRFEKTHTKKWSDPARLRREVLFEERRWSAPRLKRGSPLPPWRDDLLESEKLLRSRSYALASFRQR